MPIINVRHYRNNRWKRKVKNNNRKKPRSSANYSESVRAKWFCCAFRLSFVQWICKPSLIFTSNLELASSIIKYSIKEQILLQLKNKKWHFIGSTLNITIITLIDRNVQNSNNGDGGSDDFNNYDGDIDNEIEDGKDNDDGDTTDDGGDDEKFGDDGCANYPGDDNDDDRDADDDGGNDEK